MPMGKTSNEQLNISFLSSALASFNFNQTSYNLWQHEWFQKEYVVWLPEKWSKIGSGYDCRQGEI